MTDDLRIAEMVCTRLCHDLTGPIGAVNNGAEFLNEEGFDMQSQAVDLIVSSALEAVSRLQFFRQAYGRVNDQGEAALSEKKRITQDFFSGSKVVLDWPDQYTDATTVSISNKMVRLMMNMIIIAAATLIKGGTISVKLDIVQDNAKEVRITATGPMVKWETEMAQALEGKTVVDALTPKSVQPYLSWRLAKEINANITTSASDDKFEIIATKPHQTTIG